MTSWKPTDCHAHSTHSDGVLSVAEVQARGESLGVRASVSDHISRDAPTSVNSVATVERYLEDLEQYDVLRGGEFCWHDTLWRQLPAALVKRFTHRIGSLHSIRLNGGSMCRAFVTTLPEGLTADEYVEAHVHSLETLAREMPVDILAHPTLLPPPLRALDPHELWTEEREERMVNALEKAGMAFEVSYRYVPHQRIVQRAVNAGVRLSLGSDGHSRVQVGDIAGPLATARSLGVPDDQLYDPAVHGSRTGAFSG